MGYKHIRIILLSFTCWDLTFVLSLSYGLAPRELCWHLWDSCLPLPTAYTLSQVQIFPLAKEKTRNKNKTKNKANNKIQPRNLSSWKALSALWGLELLATEISKDQTWVILSWLGRASKCLSYPTSWLLPLTQHFSFPHCQFVLPGPRSIFFREHLLPPMLLKQKPLLSLELHCCV